MRTASPWSEGGVLGADRTPEPVEDDLPRRGLHRDTCSQLLAIPDAAYASGLARIEAEVAAAGAAPLPVAQKLTLVKIAGEKP
jgi:hypothetical protein